MALQVRPCLPAAVHSPQRDLGVGGRRPPTGGRDRGVRCTLPVLPGARLEQKLDREAVLAVGLMTPWGGPCWTCPRLCVRVRTLNVGEGLVHSLPEGFSCFCLAVQINVCVGLWQCLPVVPGSRPGPGSPPGRRPAPALLLLAKDSALCTCGGGAAWRARWELGAEGRRGACSAPRARTVARREPGRSGPPGSSARLRGRGPEVRAQARAQARGAGSRLRSGRPP